MNYKFNCPHCGGTKLDEHCSSDFIISRINNIFTSEEIVELGYGTPELAGDVHIIAYVCANCGKPLIKENGEEVDCPEDLVEYLKTNCGSMEGPHER